MSEETQVTEEGSPEVITPENSASKMLVIDSKPTTESASEVKEVVEENTETTVVEEATKEDAPTEEEPTQVVESETPTTQLKAHVTPDSKPKPPRVLSNLEEVCRNCIDIFKGSVKKIYFKRSKSGKAYSLIVQKDEREDLILHNLTNQVFTLPAMNPATTTEYLKALIIKWSAGELPHNNVNITNLFVTTYLKKSFANCTTSFGDDMDEVINYFVCNYHRFQDYIEYVMEAITVLCEFEATEIVHRDREYTCTYLTPKGTKHLEYFQSVYNVRSAFSIPRTENIQMSPELEEVLQHLSCSVEAFGYVIKIHKLTQQFVPKHIDVEDLTLSMTSDTNNRWRR